MSRGFGLTFRILVQYRRYGPPTLGEGQGLVLPLADDIVHAVPIIQSPTHEIAAHQQIEMRRLALPTAGQPGEALRVHVLNRCQHVHARRKRTPARSSSQLPPPSTTTSLKVIDIVGATDLEIQRHADDSDSGVLAVV